MIVIFLYLLDMYYTGKIDLCVRGGGIALNMKYSIDCNEIIILSKENLHV